MSSEGLEQELWFDTLFELADLWTATAEPRECTRTHALHPAIYYILFACAPPLTSISLPLLSRRRQLYLGALSQGLSPGGGDGRVLAAQAALARQCGHQSEEYQRDSIQAVRAFTGTRQASKEQGQGDNATATARAAPLPPPKPPPSPPPRETRGTTTATAKEATRVRPEPQPSRRRATIPARGR